MVTRGLLSRATHSDRSTNRRMPSDIDVTPAYRKRGTITVPLRRVASCRGCFMWMHFA